MKIPGVIDLQVNGFKGVGYSDPNLSAEKFEWSCGELFRAGTSGFLATMITSPTETYRKNLPIIAESMKKEELRGRVLGIHLEGPFISPEKGACGAHNPQWTRDPDVEYLKRLVDWADGQVKMLTIAAERPGAEKLCHWASEQGITVSLGHQMADETDLQRLFEAGAGALTHFGNGLPKMLPRHPNVLWAGLANDDLWITLITDGHHLPDSVIKSFIRAKGTARSVVISDCSPVAGCAPGEYKSLGNVARLEENGRLYNPQTGYLVGSSVTMLDCMNYLASLELLEPEELVQVGFENPLKLINMESGSVRCKYQISYDRRENVFTVGKNKQ